MALVHPLQSHSVDPGLIRGEIDSGLAEFDNFWNKGVARYWRCAVENRTSNELVPLGVTEVHGCLDTPLPNIPPGHVGLFVWVKPEVGRYGACGVVHYKIGSLILNIMGAVEFDWLNHPGRINIRVCHFMEGFENLYEGKNGCARPTRVGNWATVDDCVLHMRDDCQGTMRVIVSHDGRPTVNSPRRYTSYNTKPLV